MTTILDIKHQILIDELRLAERLQKEGARTQRRQFKGPSNEQFAALTRAEQRVAIARDVLEWQRVKKLRARGLGVRRGPLLGPRGARGRAHDIRARVRAQTAAGPRRQPRPCEPAAWDGGPGRCLRPDPAHRTMTFLLGAPCLPI
jgi:hypothetical protein